MDRRAESHDSNAARPSELARLPVSRSLVIDALYFSSLTSQAAVNGACVDALVNQFLPALVAVS